MHVLSALPAASQGMLGRPTTLRSHAVAQRMALAVASIGHLVPRTDFVGRVHSVFARACNVTCDGGLLTLCAHGTGNGPTTLCLAQGAALDLRDLFEVGESVRGRRGCVQTGRVELRLMHAAVWRPMPLGRLLPRQRIQLHLRSAAVRLAQRRGTHPSVIDGAGAGVVSALRDACRALDSEQAVRHVDRLIGWGEGLTPAGDDFLIGLIAGLDALVSDDERRREFRHALTSGFDALAQRTTAIAAHHLRLAAGGHCTEPLLRLRHALLCEDDEHAVDAALRGALAIGATSGADTVSGLLTGLLAWLPAPASVDTA